jgi:hypothetical protein
MKASAYTKHHVATNALRTDSMLEMMLLLLVLCGYMKSIIGTIARWGFFPCPL